ncbi:MAG: hypothetical protein MZW92_77295 [Comamonadaceae bacterium]|nr:hypothetical protein [Comamonadaceae bacterium]
MRETLTRRCKRSVFPDQTRLGEVRRPIDAFDDDDKQGGAAVPARSRFSAGNLRRISSSGISGV